MKGKGLIGLIIALVVLGFVVFFASQNSGSTIKKQLSNFAIEDTASITKVLLSDKNNNTVLLEREDDGTWLANKDFRARRDVIQNLLKTIKEVTVRAPISKSRFEYTVKQLAVNSTKVEIYQNGANKPSKVYFVGGANPDNTGSYMLLENSSVPFLMHIEGHYGFIQSRYSPRINDWKDNSIWYFPGEKITNIKKVTVTYPQDASKSFEIEQQDKENYQLKDANGTPIQLPSNGVLYDYLKRYRKISYEGFEETKTAEFKDSITTQTPVQTIYRVEEISGRVTEIKTYHKPVQEDAVDIDGMPIPHDLERMYATINNDQFVIVQYYVFDPLTVALKDLLPPS